MEPTKLANKHLYGHLNKRWAVCVYAGKHSSKFICFDVDEKSPETVRKIVNTLVSLAFPKEMIYVSTSGNKGFHVEIFFSKLMYTSDLRSIYDYVCEKAQLDKAKVEFRPTATQSIKLPLSVHRKTGNMCWYLNNDTLEPYSYPEYILEIEQVDHDEAMDIVRNIHAVAEGRPTEKVVHRRVLTEEELKEIESAEYPVLRETGTRNSLMVHIAVKNRYRHATPDECREELEKWCKAQDQDLIGSTPDEIAHDIDGLVAWVFSDKFNLNASRKDVTFYKKELRIILAQPNRSTRKVAFLILLYNKLYGSLRTKYTRIAKMLDISKNTAVSAISSLRKAGWIKVEPGKVKIAENGYTRDLSKYWISNAAFSWSSEQFAKQIKIPAKTKSKVFDVNFIQDSLVVPRGEDIDVQSLYQKVFTTFMTESDMQRCLTKKEILEITGGK